MSDEQTIYISPDDDLTTVRERLKQITARKITLVIPNQTQLRSQTVWKILYADARNLSKDVVIVSSDPQVRSVAHAGKFKVAHSLESISNSGYSKGGSSAGAGRTSSGTSRGRSTGSSAPTKTQTTVAKESPGRRGASRGPRSARAPLAQNPTWLESNSFLHPDEEPPDSRSPQFDDPHTVKPPGSGPSRLNPPEQNERREEQSPHQIYDFRSEALPPIHPLPLNQIEESDLLPYTPIDREDYEKARDILQAATGSHSVLQEPEDVEPGIVSSDDVPPSIRGTGVPMDRPASTNQFGWPGKDADPAHTDQLEDAGPTPTNQFERSLSPVYGEDDPFIMQGDAQRPEQMGGAVLQGDENSQEYPLLQKSGISDLPTHMIESRSEYRESDEDDIIPFPISSTSSAQARARDDEAETAEKRPFGVPPWEEEDQLPAVPERSVPIHELKPITFPTPPAQSKPLTPAAKSLPSLMGGPTQTPIQRPGAAPRTRDSSRVSPAKGSSRAPQPIQSSRGSQRPGSAVNAGTRRSTARTRSRMPTRLYLLLVSIAAILVVVFVVLYLNMASTVTLTVATQNYASAISLTLSDKNLPNTVSAQLKQQSFTKTASEPATGTTMQATNYASGTVYFTNTGPTKVEIPSNVTLATASGVAFKTTVDALILPQSQMTNLPPVPVQVQAVNSGTSGNVLANTIIVIPADTLASIAQAQTPVVTVDSLKTTLTVSNTDPITGGEAHQVPAVTQQDLDNAKEDLDAQVQTDINVWWQQNAVSGLVGQPVVVNDTLVNSPAVGTAAPDHTFSASISVTATVLIAHLDDVQKAAVSQLNRIVQADTKFGSTFAIIGSWQTINIDLAHQQASDSKTVTVTAHSKVGPNLNRTDLQNSIKNKSFSDAKTFLRKDLRIQKVDIQTQPGIFWWVSPWADHITVIIQ